MHQNQLSAHYSLVITDDFMKAANMTQSGGGYIKYYATLAKISHTWRENSRQMFDAWCKLFGDAQALKHAKRLPPRTGTGSKRLRTHVIFCYASRKFGAGVTVFLYDLSFSCSADTHVSIQSASN